MKIFLDDNRKAPAGYNAFQTVKSAEMMLDMFHQDVEVLSIDYDLGEGETTMELLEHIARKGYRLRHINIHSTHSEGVPALWKYCEEHFPETKVTTNKID